MAKVEDWINVRPDGAMQLNLSVKRDDAENLAAALEQLKRKNLTASKSELAVKAIIGYVTLINNI